MENANRALWAGIVLQAKADLEQEPIGSVSYHHAGEFFVGRGEWATSRAVIAECLDMHPDDLYRCGKDWIAARRLREASYNMAACAGQLAAMAA